MKTPRVGIIGGSGLGQALGALGQGERHHPETPFGLPSSEITLTEVAGVPVALLARHGAGHRFSPTQVPYRANLYALKALGVTQILATTAVGSLKEAIAPKHLVVPDQIIDKTYRRPGTFFDDVVVHAEFAAPFCPRLRKHLLATGSRQTQMHEGGTYVCMEGPQFSTRAESELHRSWGASLIGMTAMPEAKLAREAELCYALLALPTDYDCWRPAPAHLSRHELLKEIWGNLRAATENAIDVLTRVLPRLSGTEEASGSACNCPNALEHALWTEPAQVPVETRRRLGLLLGRHFSAD